jgi:hypothetical protein
MCSQSTLREAEEAYISMQHLLGRLREHQALADIVAHSQAELQQLKALRDALQASQ